MHNKKREISKALATKPSQGKKELIKKFFEQPK